MIDHAVNARIQDMRIASKISLADEDNEFDGKYLSKEQMSALLEYYNTCSQNRAVRNFWKCSSLPSMPVDLSLIHIYFSTKSRTARGMRSV